MLLIIMCLVNSNLAFVPNTHTSRGGARARANTLQNLNMNSIEIGNLPHTQVISDVDDTLKSSGGVKIGDIALGGIDVQYSRGDFYPGVFQFMLELSRSTADSSSPPKVAILTARAEEFKLALELKDDSKLAVAFRETGESAGIEGWGLGPVLYGSVAEWVIQSK